MPQLWSAWAFRADCRKKKKIGNGQRKQNNHTNQQKDSAASPEGIHDVFVCIESLFTTTFPNSWVVDSGSTSHIARDNKSFTSMQSFQGEIDMFT